MAKKKTRKIFKQRLRNVVYEKIEGLRDSRDRQKADTKDPSTKRITQKTIAEMCGIHYKTMNSYIRDDEIGASPGAFPRPEHLVSIAKNLNVSLDYLFGLSEVKELNHYQDEDSIANSDNCGKMEKLVNNQKQAEINEELRKISNYTGLSAAAMHTLHSYVRTQDNLSMLNTVNWLLQSVKMGSMFSEYEAQGSGDYPTIKFPDVSDDLAASNAVEMPPLDEDAAKEDEEYVNSGSHKETLRMMAEALVGSSVLQLIDSYLHTDFDCCDLYDITADGGIYNHATGRDGDMIPLKEIRAAVLSCDLVENYYLEQIKKALRDMKHRSKPPV